MKKELHYKSRNPPLDKQILLQTSWGDWGIGIAYKYKQHRRVYFNFQSENSHLLGEEKETFKAWMSIPE